jgi:hypothetical protein
MKGHLCTWGEQCPLFTGWIRTMTRMVRVYDNGGATADRYTVLISRTVKGVKMWDPYTMSNDPQSPQGFNLCSMVILGDLKIDALGERVHVLDLSKEVITAIEHLV